MTLQMLLPFLTGTDYRCLLQRLSASLGQASPVRSQRVTQPRSAVPLKLCNPGIKGGCIVHNGET